MTVYTTANEIGIKEDVSEIISNITPTDTPFISSIATRAVHNVVYSWLTDVLDTPGVNAQAEGSDATFPTLNAPTILSNTTQILMKSVNTSDTENEVALHGRSEGAQAYNMAKAGKAIKRDLEFSCVGSKQTEVTSVSGRQFAGVQAQIPGSTSTSGSTGGVFGTGSGTTPLSEANLTSALEYLYMNGADPKTVLIHPGDALNVAGFAQEASRYRTLPGNMKTVTNAVTLYVSPYGEVAIVLDREMAAGDTLVYNPDYWKLAVLKPWYRKVLAPTGHSEKEAIYGEYGLQHTNPLASALIRRQ